MLSTGHRVLRSPFTMQSRECCSWKRWAVPRRYSNKSGARDEDTNEYKHTRAPRRTMNPPTLYQLSLAQLFSTEPALIDVVSHVQDEISKLPDYLQQCWHMRPLNDPTEDMSDACRAILLLHETLAQKYPMVWHDLSKAAAFGLSSAFDPNDKVQQVLEMTWEMYWEYNDEEVLIVWEELAEELTRARQDFHRTQAHPSPMTRMLAMSWYDDNVSAAVPSLRMLRERQIVYPRETM